MHKLKCLLIILSIASLQSAFADSLDASVTANMTAQKTACDKNTAMEWSSKLSRCIGKQAAVDARNKVNACDSFTDLEAKKKCQLGIAEGSTGLSADTSKLNQGGTTGSMVMNGAAAAYVVSGMILNKAKDKSESGCMSKKILGITAVAGLASDVYLKMSAKKKVKELEEKYLVDAKNTAYEAQVKALEYLKEEQQTVVSIASLEKKRNMVLMLGYGLAAGWAVYEMTGVGSNPGCVKPDPAQEASAKADAAPSSAPATSPTSSPTIKPETKLPPGVIRT